MKRLLLSFVSRWWLSPLCILGCTGVLCGGLLLTLFQQSPTLRLLSAILEVCGAFGIVLFLVLSLVAIVRALVFRRWGNAVLALLAVVLCFFFGRIAIRAVIFGPVFDAMFLDEDHFADDLSIPGEIEIAEPDEATSWFAGKAASGEDPYSAAVTNALAHAGTSDATVSADVPSFARLVRDHRNLLLRYLSAHPGWRVFEEHGFLYATRTMRRGGEWIYPLHGYYSDFSHRTPDGPAEPYQIRVTIGFPNPWWNRNPHPTRLAPGERAVVEVSKGNPGTFESHVIVSAGNACIEILEESSTPERRLTKALLHLLEEELRPLAESPDPETIRDILPSDAVVRGESPDIVLKDGMQGGIYKVRILANPKEPGLVYLKAFEVTTGSPLSETRLPDKSSLRLGWSDDSGELFSGATEITIYEGNWGQYYAARFELWFRPDSGTPERKITEKVYRIQGWQR